MSDEMDLDEMRAREAQLRQEREDDAAYVRKRKDEMEAEAALILAELNLQAHDELHRRISKKNNAS